jgi:RDD family.
MSDQVIEPSEILVEQDYARSKPAEVNPWIRFLARFFDYSLFCLSLLLIKKIFHIDGFSDSWANLIPFEFFSWIPIEALLLFAWGKTPGKWFLKTHLRFRGKPRPDFLMALRRSVSVWWRGLGLGIPILNALCLLVAYQRLKLTHTTSWDRDDRIYVTHHFIPQWRIIAAALFASIGMLVYFSLKNAG